MSKNEKVTENKEQTEQKVMTKYDRKVQKRKEEKEKEKKEERISTAIGIVVLVALVCLVASFPIRTYLATHETYVVVNGEAVNKVEFDYQYNLTKNNYITQYGSYLTYFGLDTSKDLSTQMYSETLTWKDYFEQNAVESLKKPKQPALPTIPRMSTILSRRPSKPPLHPQASPRRNMYVPSTEAMQPWAVSKNM